MIVLAGREGRGEGSTSRIGYLVRCADDLLLCPYCVTTSELIMYTIVYRYHHYIHHNIRGNIESNHCNDFIFKITNTHNQELLVNHKNNTL